MVCDKILISPGILFRWKTTSKRLDGVFKIITHSHVALIDLILDIFKLVSGVSSYQYLLSMIKQVIPEQVRFNTLDFNTLKR